MALSNPAKERIEKLQAEIESLKQAHHAELSERRQTLARELADIDAELGNLSGKAPEPKRRGTRRPSHSTPPRNLPLQELKELLGEAPERTLNVRKENLDLPNIKTLVSANPSLLKLGGKGAWPTVTLLK